METEEKEDEKLCAVRPESLNQITLEEEARPGQRMKQF